MPSKTQTRVDIPLNAAISIDVCIMNDDRMWLHVHVLYMCGCTCMCTYTRPGLTQCVQYSAVPGTLFSQFASCSGRWFVALRYGAALTACRHTGMIRHRCIKLFIFHTKINYRFYSHSINKHGICVWLKKNSAEFFIKLNIGTRIGKDSQILPIRCFTDIAKNRPDPMSDPIIGWSLLSHTLAVNLALQSGVLQAQTCHHMPRHSWLNTHCVRLCTKATEPDFVQSL